MPGPNAETGGQECLLAEGSHPPTASSRRAGEGEDSLAPQWERGPVGPTPPTSARRGKYRHKSPQHLRSIPSAPAAPGAWVRESGTPVTGWPLLSSLEPNFRRGPRRVFRRKRLCLGGWGGGGAPGRVGGRGEGTSWGRCPGGPDPGRKERPPPAPQQ